MTAPTLSKPFRIRVRRTRRDFTFRCSSECGVFGRRKTEIAILRAADAHADLHARRGEATSVELGALNNNTR